MVKSKLTCVVVHTAAKDKKYKDEEWIIVMEEFLKMDLQSVLAITSSYYIFAIQLN